MVVEVSRSGQMEIFRELLDMRSTPAIDSAGDLNGGERGHEEECKRGR